MARSILISGIQPSGRLHIGNYLGALKNFVELQNSGKYECYFFIADYHSLTGDFDERKQSEQTIDLAASFMAAGLDAKKSTLFIQSEVPRTIELSLILSSLITAMGDLERMTQFKEKGENRPRAKVGLFTYPILMTADIILYDAEFVPVGDDQLQHLELAREIVRKFNNRFGKTFVEPKPILTKAPRVMSLNDPGKKMSKSQPEGCLFLDDEPEVIKKKISRAVTDSGNEVKFDEKKKAGIANLMRVYQGITHKAFADIEAEFRGRNYSAFKTALGDIIAKHLEPFRTKKAELTKNQKVVRAAFDAGAKVASAKAKKKMAAVKKAIGLTL